MRLEGRISMPKKNYGTTQTTPSVRPNTNPNVVSSGEPGCEDRHPNRGPGNGFGHEGHKDGCKG